MAGTAGGDLVTRIPAATPDNLEPAGQWLHRAACRGRGDEMFPESSEADIAAAKAICRPCPVWRDCLADALRTGDNEHGIRGGLKACERRALARETAFRNGQRPDPEPIPERTLQTLWDERTKADGEHLLWDAGTPVYFGGRTLTPQRIGFRLGRDREPVGVVRRTCEREGCVLPAHLADQRDRDRKRMAERRAAERLAVQAVEEKAVAS